MSQLDLFTTSAARPDGADSNRAQPRGDSAVFSPDGVYRYVLERDLGGDRLVVLVGCNPSVANAEENDNTISKEVGFVTRWGCGRLVKVNAFAFVETKPKLMRAAAKAGTDIVGPENDDYIRRAISRVLLGDGLLVLACGNDVPGKRLLEIEHLVRFSGVTPMCLGRNGKDHRGAPKHTLYLPYSTPLVPYELGVLAA